MTKFGRKRIPADIQHQADAINELINGVREQLSLDFSSYVRR